MSCTLMQVSSSLISCLRLSGFPWRNGPIATFSVISKPHGVLRVSLPLSHYCFDHTWGQRVVRNQKIDSTLQLIDIFSGFRYPSSCAPTKARSQGFLKARACGPDRRIAPTIGLCLVVPQGQSITFSSLNSQQRIQRIRCLSEQVATIIGSRRVIEWLAYSPVVDVQRNAAAAFRKPLNWSNRGQEKSSRDHFNFVNKATIRPQNRIKRYETS